MRLWIQSDNTVKEVKNSLSGVMMSALITARYFDECGHHHLPVGHTHEDIGLAAKSVAASCVFSGQAWP